MDAIADNPNVKTSASDLDKMLVDITSEKAAGTEGHQGQITVREIRRHVVSTANVTEAAPTDAELDAAFGTPAVLGNGFVGIVSDNDAATASVLCWTSKGAWFHVVGTKST